MLIDEDCAYNYINEHLDCCSSAIKQDYKELECLLDDDVKVRKTTCYQIGKMFDVIMFFAPITWTQKCFYYYRYLDMIYDNVMLVTSYHNKGIYSIERNCLLNETKVEEDMKIILKFEIPEECYDYLVDYAERYYDYETLPKYYEVRCEKTANLIMELYDGEIEQTTAYDILRYDDLEVSDMLLSDPYTVEELIELVRNEFPMCNSDVLAKIVIEMTMFPEDYEGIIEYDDVFYIDKNMFLSEIDGRYFGDDKFPEEDEDEEEEE